MKDVADDLPIHPREPLQRQFPGVGLVGKCPKLRPLRMRSDDAEDREICG